MASNSISTRILLQGGKEFADQFKTIASNIKEASSALKLMDKEIEINGKSVDSLKGRMSQLQKEYDLHAEAIDLVTKKMAELQERGKLTEQVQAEFTNEINNHKIAQRDLVAEMSRTSQELDKLESNTDDAEQEMRQLDDQTKKTGQTLGSDFAMDVALATKALDLVVDAAIEVGKAIYSVGKDAVEYNAQMESYTRTIEAFFKTSGQGAEEAAANTADLIQNQKDLAKQIGIGTDYLIDANKMLIASGIDGNKAQQAVSALAKSIVATGGGNDELQRMASNLMQIQNAGKATAMDMRQFAYAGVDVYGLLAETTGKTVAELKKMDITFDMIVSALDSATQEGGKFFEASQVGATTLNGQWNILKTTVQESLGEAFIPINETLRDKLIPAAIELVEDIDWESIGNAIAFLADELSDTFDTIRELKDWYESVYGPPAVKSVETMTDSLEDAGLAFLENAGAIEIVDAEMANAVESMKGHGNHMRIEGENTARQAQYNIRDIAGKAKQELIDFGWDAMALGETSAANVAKGIQNNAGKVESATANLRAIAARSLSALGSESTSWGMHMIDGFVQGINIKIPSVGTAAQRAANAVREVLEFTRPDKGPLHNYEEWMPHMMQGLQKGIDDNMWRIQQSAANIAGTLAVAEAPVTNYNGGINLTVNAAQGQSANEIADVVMNKIQKATQRRVAVWA